MKRMNKKLKNTLIIAVILLMFIFTAGFSVYEDGDGEGLLLTIIGVLFLSGPIFYIFISTFYSGKDKRHFHEKETEADVRNLRQTDKFIKTITNSEEDSIGSIKYSNQVDFGSVIANQTIEKGRKFLQ